MIGGFHYSRHKKNILVSYSQQYVFFLIWQMQMKKNNIMLTQLNKRWNRYV